MRQGVSGALNYFTIDYPVLGSFRQEPAAIFIRRRTTQSAQRDDEHDGCPQKHLFSSILPLEVFLFLPKPTMFLVKWTVLKDSRRAQPIISR